MLILPDRNIPRTKILLPVYDREWRTPSQAQPKNIFGHQNQTRFSATARLHDGHIVWRGWFDDRDDFDAFVWGIVTGSIQYERALWRLPTPWWHPDVPAPLGYDFLTTSFIVSTSASNQTDAVPSDWNISSNSVDVIAGGGSGGAGINVVVGGGGGGAWAQQINLVLTPGGTATFFLNVGAGAVSESTTTLGIAGNDGSDSWYNGTTLLGSSVGAAGGKRGTGSGTGGSGGTKANSVGASKNAGGSGGTGSVGPAAGGGGGAAGLNGNGNAAPAATSVAGVGGQGDSTFGGAGGAIATNGSPGTEYDGSHGSGGGGGGSITTSPAGSGGNYGAGGGGTDLTTGTATSGTGAQGLIVKQYTPFTPISVSLWEVGVPRRRYVGYKVN